MSNLVNYFSLPGDTVAEKVTYLKENTFTPYKRIGRDAGLEKFAEIKAIVHSAAAPYIPDNVDALTFGKTLNTYFNSFSCICCFPFSLF